MTMRVDPEWWKTLFDEIYLLTDARSVCDDELTRREIDVISELIPIRPGHLVLDLCGGHGRHSLALCERGYKNCTVLDYSACLIKSTTEIHACESYKYLKIKEEIMNTIQIMPCLDMKDRRVVKGIHFVDLKDAGDAVENASFYEKEGADELAMLDIAATLENRKTMLNWVKSVSSVISIPLTVGGGISSLEDIKSVFGAGADKISANKGSAGQFVRQGSGFTGCYHTFNRDEMRS